MELVLFDSRSQASGIREPREKQQGHHMGPPLSHDAKGDMKKKKRQLLSIIMISCRRKPINTRKEKPSFRIESFPLGSVKTSLHHLRFSHWAAKCSKLHVGMKIGNHQGRVLKIRRMRLAAKQGGRTVLTCGHRGRPGVSAGPPQSLRCEG